MMVLEKKIANTGSQTVSCRSGKNRESSEEKHECVDEDQKYSFNLIAYYY